MQNTDTDKPVATDTAVDPAKDELFPQGDGETNMGRTDVKEPNDPPSGEPQPEPATEFPDGDGETNMGQGGNPNAQPDQPTYTHGVDDNSAGVEGAPAHGLSAQSSLEYAHVRINMLQAQFDSLMLKLRGVIH